MAGAFVELRIDDRSLQSMLKRLLKRMGDLTPVMREIGEIVTESIMRNFEQHRAPDGTTWEPLAKSTKKAKVRIGRNPDDILISNRILMGSIHPEAFRDRMVITAGGTNIIYAAIHHLGGLAGRGRKTKIPARPYLGVRDDDWPEIKASVKDWILET